MTNQIDDSLVLEVNKVEYPKNLTLWKLDIPDSDKINFINPEDFHLEEVIDAIGLRDSDFVKSLGITDTEEIQARNELIAWLHANKKAREFIMQMSQELSLPQTQESFLTYYNPDIEHWPHWRRVRGLLSMLNQSANLPKRLAALRDSLQNHLKLEPVEKNLSSHIVSRLESMVKVEGIVGIKMLCKYYDTENGMYKFDYEWRNIEQINVVGHQEYSQDVSLYDDIQYPDWTQKPWYKSWKVLCGLAALKRYLIRKRVSRNKKAAYERMKISRLSEELQYDLTEAVKKLLNDSCKNRKPFKKFCKDLHLDLKVHFHYNSNGLSIKILSTDVVNALYPNPERMEHRYDQQYEDERMYQTIKKQIQQMRYSIEGISFFSMLSKWLPGHGDEMQSVLSTASDRKHRWFALSNVYRSKNVEPLVAALEKHRNFFYSHIKTLKQVVSVTEKQIKAAKRLKCPLSAPQILSSSHLVEFDSIYPVRLLGRDDVKSYVKISGIPALNGSAVCLTGEHAAGKTTSSFAVVENLFLAQSGLMVFGKGFKTNIKKHMGFVISERGKGSKAELLISKLKNVLEALKGVDGKDAIFVFDELGTGTQETAGLELGRDVIAALKLKQVSLLFNTQIQDLALWAQNQQGAKCVYIDSERRWSPGIRDGGLSRLRKTSGFNDSLNSLSKLN